MSTLIGFNQGDDGQPLADGDGRGGGDGHGDFFTEHPVVGAIVCYGWLLAFFYCLVCRKTGERPSTAVGDSIRARAREYRERSEQKKAKLEQSPEERNRLVDNALHTRVVLSKDARGNMILGNVGDELPPSSDVEAPPGGCVECPPAAADAAADDQNGGDLPTTDEDEEDCMCVICLDSFEPGDAVSWSKNDSDCTHVFHTECIRQWLVDRRQDECPACRCRMVQLPDVCGSDLQKVEGGGDTGGTPAAAREEDDEDEDDEGAPGEEEEADATEAASAARSKDEPSFFVIMHGLISRTIAPSRRAPSGQASSGRYNLVSVDSDDSSDSREEDGQNEEEEVPDLEGLNPPRHDDGAVRGSAPPSSSLSRRGDDDADDDDDGASSGGGPRYLLPSSSAPEEHRAGGEATDEDAENPPGVVGGRRTELDLEHAVTDIVFSH